jgi:hypothetical protein
VKLTKSKLKQLIKEELEEGFFGGQKQEEPINYIPTSADYPLSSSELYDAVHRYGGELQDEKKQEAIDTAVKDSNDLINTFLDQTTSLTNIERHIAMGKLIRHLSMVIDDGKTKDDLREDQMQEK